VLALLKSLGQVLLAAGGKLARVLLRSGLPRARELSLRAGRIALTLHQRHVGPQLGALRRLVASQWTGRRRRTTAAPAELRRASSLGAGRILLLAVLASAAIALGVYALVPSGTDDGVNTHRPIATEAPTPGQATEPLAPVRIEEAAQPVDPKTLPSAAAGPPRSPFAVDVRERTPARPASSKLRFGASQVPDGRRFSLRMSAPVKSLQGIPDSGGFTVIIAGALSLDRAGPIAAAHKAVQRAMVINKGDRAELSIRFAPGKAPAYQVTAEGSTLHLVLGD
jgi:hypothetical protein